MHAWRIGPTVFFPTVFKVSSIHDYALCIPPPMFWSWQQAGLRTRGPLSCVHSRVSTQMDTSNSFQSIDLSAYPLSHYRPFKHSIFSFFILSLHSSFWHVLQNVFSFIFVSIRFLLFFVVNPILKRGLSCQSGRVKPKGAVPPPPPRVMKAGRNHFNVLITPPPPHWDRREI